MPAAIPNRITISLRIDEIAHAKAKIIARIEDRPLNSQIEHYVKKGIELYEKEHGEIILEHE